MGENVPADKESVRLNALVFKRARPLEATAERL